MKKIISIALCFISILLFSVTAFANAPGKAKKLIFEISNLPNDVVYADLLIKMEEDDKQYVEFQEQSFVENQAAVEELVNYSIDGYRSFTFHYKEAESNIKIEPFFDDGYCVSFGDGFSQKELLRQHEDLRKNYNEVKIALLDEEYHILSVSDVCEIPKEDKMFSFGGTISYDAESGEFTVDRFFNPYYVVVSALSVIMMILLSVFLEWLVAVLFKFSNKERVKILIVNVCTQVAMRLLYFVLPFSYVVETIILEALVYGSEILIYKKTFKEKTVGNVLVYTVVANTISLIIGLLVGKIL